jgi:hypothetical protein
MTKDSIELNKLNEKESKVYKTLEEGKLNVIEHDDYCVISKAKIAVTACGIFLLIGVFALFIRMSVTE